MAFFDLATDGVTLFQRVEPVLVKRKVARDPLSGLVDGANQVFYTSYAPILTSGSLSVFTSGSLVGGTVDYETGEVTLAAAPSVQPAATYTFTPFTTSAQLSFLIAGFHLMETRWPRGWKLVDAGGVAADETSAAVRVVDSGGADPACGTLTFSTSQAQIGFFFACLRLAYLLTRLTGASVDDFMWRETLRGMTVDKTRRPSNISLAIDQARKEVEGALERAQDEYYTNGEHLGGYVGSPMSIEYVEGLEWQTDAESEDNRSRRGGAYLPQIDG